MDRPDSKAIAWRVSSPFGEKTLFSIRKDGGWRRIRQLLVDSPHLAHTPTLEHGTRTRECIGSSSLVSAATVTWQSGEEQLARPIHANSCTPSSLQRAVRHRSDPIDPVVASTCGRWGGAALSPPQREAEIVPQHQTLGNVRSTSCYGRGRAEAGSSELTCRTLDRYRTTFLLFFHLRTVSDEDSRHASPGPPRRKKMPVSFFALSNPAKKVENSVSSCPEKLLFLSFFLAPSLAPSRGIRFCQKKTFPFCIT